MSKYIDVEPIIEWAKDPEAQEPYGASGVDWERKIFNAPTIDIDLADDGTLSVEVDDATKVTRVLVEDGKNGDLYYADRPQGEWVPCSERLPEYRKLVLVTTRDLRVKPAYLDSIQDDGTDDWWSIPLDDADCALWNIVAWMPLPAPWKGADDE